MNALPKIVPYVPFIIPFLVPFIGIVVSIPLVLQKVPPNWWYGFRTRKTLSNPDIWYAANYQCGVNMVIAGVAALMINAVIFLIAPLEVAMPVGSMIGAISIGISVVISATQIRRL